MTNKSSDIEHIKIYFPQKITPLVATCAQCLINEKVKPISTKSKQIILIANIGLNYARFIQKFHKPFVDTCSGCIQLTSKLF